MGHPSEPSEHFASGRRSLSRTRSTLQLWLGIVVSMLFLYLALRGVEWGKLLVALRGVLLPLVLLSLLAMTATLLVRALRWRVLLTPAGQFSTYECLAYVVIGYLASTLLPLRAGEVIRPMLFGQKTGASKSTVFATVIVERIFDLLSMVVLIGVLMVTMEMPTDIKRAGLVVEAGAVLGFAALWLTSRTGQSDRVIRLVSTPIPRRWQRTAVGLVDSFLVGLGTLNNWRQLVHIGLYSLLAWFLGILGVSSMLSAFGLRLPWYASLFVIMVVNLAMMIPSVPGYVGVAHFAYVLALSAFGVDRSIALGYALVGHGTGYVLIVVLGFAFLWLEGLAFGELRRAEGASSIR